PSSTCATSCGGSGCALSTRPGGAGSSRRCRRRSARAASAAGSRRRSTACSARPTPSSPVRRAGPPTSARARPTMPTSGTRRWPLLFYRLLELDESGPRQPSIMARRIRPAARLLPYLEGGDRELDAELDEVARLLPAEPGLFPDELIDVCASALRNQPVLLVI